MQIASKLVVRACAVAAVTMALACGTGGTDRSTGVSSSVLTTITVSLSAPLLAPGETATATAVGTDQNGASVALSGVTWTSSAQNVATVNASGVVTAVGAGTAQIVATSAGKSGAATITVTSGITTSPVANVTVSPSASSLVIGTTLQLTANLADANGNTLAGRQISWSSSDPSIATVGPTGLVQGIAAGTATIVATSESKSGSAVVTVATSTPPPACTTTSAMQLAVGEVRSLTPAQIASLCIGGLSATSEYVMIPFNNSTVPSTTTDIQLSSMKTVAASVASTVPTAPGGVTLKRRPQLAEDGELAFRVRERQDVGAGGLRSRARVGGAPRLGASRSLTGVPANPAVGQVVQLNANLSGNTCSDPKALHPARVVTVLPHTIVLIDDQAPSGGYTDAELSAFGAAFDTLGFALDTTYFGANTDIDANGRIAIFFTPGINQIPGPVGGVIGGLFAARDLFPATSAGCVASNEGEMFYMPVPDPNATINGNYEDKPFVASLVVPTLVHEFQHLINAGRRVYVNDATEFEEVWLNEGLSHIAEELLYYRHSGNAPLQNIDLARLRSSQAQVSAFNNDQSQNFGRLSSYLGAPEMNSPYALVDGLEMRGAIWQLLRYAADRKGGNQRPTWYALVNTRLNGQANFTAVFGNITSLTRDWAIAQYTDDLGIAVASQYSHPSWNYRSIFGGIGDGRYPIATHALVAGSNVQLSLVGGGASYVRFGVPAGVAATVAATSTNQSVPPNIEIVVVRTK